MRGLDFHDRAQSLRARFQALADAEPGLRVRTMADRLGVAEVELVAAQCGDLAADRLDVRAADLFQELGLLNEAMAVTRNPWCVHERTGRYVDMRIEAQIGLALGPDIDLRAFFAHWDSVWAVAQKGRRSIQFFDRSGTAVHKVYATPNTYLPDLHALVMRYACAEPVWPALQAYETLAAPQGPVDPAGLPAGWLAMTDTPQFFLLLQRFQVTRLAAFQAVGSDLAQQIDPGGIEKMLRQVIARGVSLQCFVSNRGTVQVHTGPIYNLHRAEPWLHILDERFNLHLNTLAAASTWVVSKPTEDGWVTSLEAYAESGELIVQFYGERRQGRPEPRAWRDIMMDLCDEPLAR